MSIANASNFSLRGTLNNVQRDQINHYITTGVLHLHGIDMERDLEGCTEHNEFEYIKRGHIRNLKIIHSEENLKREPRQGEGTQEAVTGRCVHIVEIHGIKDSRFTAITYHGKASRRKWERDFLIYSRNRCADSVQLFGFNCSTIPALIFYNELIPLANVYRKELFWTGLYLAHLVKHKNWSGWRLWVDQKTGQLCVGPKGPWPLGIPEAISPMDVPSTLDMLKDENCLGYFASHGSCLDDIVLRHVFRLHYYAHPDDTLPDVLRAGLRRDGEGFQFRGRASNLLPCMRVSQILDTPKHPAEVLRSRRTWYSRVGCDLQEGTFVKGGLTRFQLSRAKAGDTIRLVCKRDDHQTLVDAWLCQSPYIFSVLRTPKEEKAKFFLVAPQSTLSISVTVRLDLVLPVYLFIRSIDPFINLSPDIDLFWSFDATGQTKISEDERKRMGLPSIILCGPLSFKLWVWPSYAYDAIRKWQISRGFDPNTTKFSQSMGYQDLQIVGKDPNNKSDSRSFWAASSDLEISALAF
ncbi:hypothetical protein Moror_3134 [Moniliophthora roreri MCA 2997]|uniref:Uncharacterized protein n=1 Tax=Moniliophthora roreri (strain MCA 2997) TaxID=1381753 RepID=V2YA77_MONRO|nr:hypothetical protein Moror_3134 [Moniliophthora roreri MCA 2997]